jgi:alpha-beta hydrolase superfamily lysophospholipase
MASQTFRFASADGFSRLLARLWLPDGPPRAVLQLLHGMSEHSGRYGEFAAYLKRAGLAVAAHDHIGHGHSVAAGQRYGFLAEREGWRLALADIQHLRALTQQKWPGLPYFMLGHSMGSFMLRSYLLSPAAAGLSGAIISGPGHMSRARLIIARLLIQAERLRLGAKGLSPLLVLAAQGGYNRRFRPNRTLVDWLSSDQAMVDDYLADPLCRKLPTVGLYGDINRAWSYVSRAGNVRRMESTLPLLLISGADDPFGGQGRALRGLYAQLRQAGCADVSQRLYPGGRHAMLYERNRQEVYADIVAWLEKTVRR